jgi:PPM family protein phosphatase
MTRFDPHQIEVASITDTGRQRTNNQDSCGEGRAPSGALLLMVADGMGGHAGGETASRVAVETVQAVVGSSQQDPEVALRGALEAANRAVHEQAQREAQLFGMGTTGVAVLFCPDGAAFVANVGDSRAYRMRDGTLAQITIDHSLVAELQRRGMLTEEEALVHPRRNEVLRSLGVEPEVAVDLHRVDLRSGDLFLLCSDGLSGVVRDVEIAEVLRREPPTQAARSLVDLANRRGGPDNVTVQIARIPEPVVATQLLVDPADREQRPRLRALSLALIAAAALLVMALLWAMIGQLRAAPQSKPVPTSSLTTITSRTA